MLRTDIYRTLWAPLLAVTAVLLLTDDAAAQIVHGVVKDSSEQPIPDAAVSLLTPKGKVVAHGLSSPDGTYTISIPAAGTFALYVRRLGFRPNRSDWRDYQESDTVSLDATMVGIPVELARVEVKAQRDSIRRMHILGMNIGTIGGRVISSAEIDQALPTSNDPYDLVQRAGVLGFMVDNNPFHRCVFSTRAMVHACLPVIVDGMLIGDPLSLPDVMAPHVVDFMVVLSALETGVQYGSIGHDGALLIFTKAGLKRRM